MASNTEPMAEVLSGLLNSLDHVGTKAPANNIKRNINIFAKIKAAIFQRFN